MRITVAALALVVAGACAVGEGPVSPSRAAPTSAADTSAPASRSDPGTTSETGPADDFDDNQEVAGFRITRVRAPQGAALPEGVGDVATYDITTQAGAPVARYLRIIPAGGTRANDATVQSLLVDLAAAHGGGTPVQTTIAGLPSWEVSGTDGTVGVARVSEDGPVVVFLGTDSVTVESMIAAISAALDGPR